MPGNFVFERYEGMPPLFGDRAFQLGWEKCFAGLGYDSVTTSFKNNGRYWQIRRLRRR